MVMAAGVLLCDVNVLAVLASIVELNALQRHRNLRRTICARKGGGPAAGEPRAARDARRAPGDAPRRYDAVDALVPVSYTHLTLPTKA